MQTHDRYHFNVGSYKCIAIRDDSEEFPLTDITADVPVEEVARAIEELGHPTAGWRVDYNCLLGETGKQRVLVDTGWGHGTWPKKGRLLQNLQAEGIAPADIDWIATTHWDLDHIGGMIDVQQGKPVFPNARCAMWRTAEQRRILEWAEDHNALIFATHFPFPGLCRARSEAERWHWQPVIA